MQEAAVREWTLLSAEDKNSLRTYGISMRFLSNNCSARWCVLVNSDLEGAMDKPSYVGPNWSWLFRRSVMSTIQTEVTTFTLRRCIQDLTRSCCVNWVQILSPLCNGTRWGRGTVRTVQSPRSSCSSVEKGMVICSNTRIRGSHSLAYRQSCDLPGWFNLM